MKRKKTNGYKRKKHKDTEVLVFSKFIKPVIFLIIFVSGILYAGRVRDLNIFKIDRVEFNKKFDRDLEDLIKGQSIFSVDIENIRSQIQENHPQIKETEVIKVFPSTIKITVTERKAYAQIKKDGYYLVDEEGMILQQAKVYPYQQLSIIEMGNYRRSLRVGSIIKDKRLKFAFKLIRELNYSRLSEKFKIQSVNASSINSISFFINDVKVIIGKNDFKEKIFFLENFLDNKFNDDITSLSYIDLRYATKIENIYYGTKR